MMKRDRKIECVCGGTLKLFFGGQKTKCLLLHYLANALSFGSTMTCVASSVVQTCPVIES